MRHAPVQSSQLASVDPETKVMEIRFSRGGLYEYTGVPADVHAALMASDSKGKHLGQHIKGKFEYKRLGD